MGTGKTRTGRAFVFSEKRIKSEFDVRVRNTDNDDSDAGSEQVIEVFETTVAGYIPLQLS